MYMILWHHHFNFIDIYTFIDVIIRVSPTSRLLNSFLVIFFVSTSLETSSSHNHKPLNWGKARGHLVVEKNWSWIYHLYSQRLYLTQWRLTRKKEEKKGQDTAHCVWEKALEQPVENLSVCKDLVTQNATVIPDLRLGFLVQISVPIGCNIAKKSTLKIVVRVL